MRIAHIPFDLCLRRERRNGVDDDEIDRAAAHERVDDVQRLLACIRLRNIQVIEVYPEFFCIDGIERMLCVHKRRYASALLDLRDRMQGDRRLA